MRNSTKLMYLFFILLSSFQFAFAQPKLTQRTEQTFDADGNFWQNKDRKTWQYDSNDRLIYCKSERLNSDILGENIKFRIISETFYTFNEVSQLTRIEDRTYDLGYNSSTTFKDFEYENGQLKKSSRKVIVDPLYEAQLWRQSDTLFLSSGAIDKVNFYKTHFEDGFQHEHTAQYHYNANEVLESISFAYHISTHPNSTITHFDYVFDANNRDYTFSTYYANEPLDPKFRERVEFDEAGNITKNFRERYKYDQGEWTTVTDIDFLFDERNNKIEENNYHHSQFTTWQYTESDLLLHRSVTTNSGTFTDSLVYVYDSEGFLIEKEVYQLVLGHPDLTIKTIHEINNFCDGLAHIERYENLPVVSRIVYEYDQGIECPELIIEEEMTFFPNPARNNLSFISDLFLGKEAVDLSVYSMTGQLVFQDKIIGRLQSFEMDIRFMQEGTYFFKFQNDQFSITKKVLIIK